MGISIQIVLNGYKLFDYFTGTNVYPPKFVIHTVTGVTSELTATCIEWESTDIALLNLLLATLSNEGIEYVLGYKTASKAWLKSC